MAVPSMFPETETDMEAFWKKMEEKDKQDVNLGLYFSKPELDEMCEYEKLRLSNITRNYEMMKELGLPAKKPPFMQKSKKRKKEEALSSSESDEEWTPALEREANKKQKGPVKSIWVAPEEKAKKPATETQQMQEDEDGLEINFDGFGEDNEDDDWNDEEYIDVGSDKPVELKSFKSDRRRLKKELKKGHVNTEEILLDYPADLENFDLEAAKNKKKRPKPKKVSQAILEDRYPKRNIPVKNYADLEMPDEDHFLFCDDCHEEYLGDCPIHGPLKVVEDSKPEEGTPNYAENTLPPGLILKDSQIPNGGSGIWSTKLLPKGVRLGPYRGEVVKSEDKAHLSGYSWQVYGTHSKNTHFMDAGDISTSNWMRYVNCARNEEEQNLLAFQYKGEIFYRTIKEIPAGHELLVWYGDEYGKELGISVRSPQNVQRLLAMIQQSSNRNTMEGGKVPYWQLHGRKLDVPVTLNMPVPNNRGFACDVCGVAFMKEDAMHKHRKNAHRHLYWTEVKRHQCDQCAYSSNSAQHLSTHMRVHTTERPYKCQYCHKRFTTHQSQEWHERTHTGEKPYQCKICDRRFTLLNHLNLHVNIHTRTTVFPCSFCDKTFTQHITLKRHVKIHTGVTDFACAYCDYKANQAGALKSHIIIHHTHDFPHRCPVCDKGYVTPGVLRKHIASQHK